MVSEVVRLAHPPGSRIEVVAELLRHPADAATDAQAGSARNVVS